MINERYTRKQDEELIDYEVRLVEILKNERPEDLEWSDIKEYVGFEGNKDSLRKANDSEFGGYKVAKHYQKKIENMLINNSNENLDTILNELEAKRLEMEKLKIQYQDQKREYKSYLRADARFEHLQQEMIYEIKKLNEYRPLYNTYINTYVGGDNEASLILSDLHLGMEINDRFNKYNKQIAKERLDDLKNKVITYCKRHNIKILHIELLGDLVNGYLHVGNRVNNEEDVISQTMLCSEMLSNFINIIAEEIPYIRIYSTVGNHGRCSANIKDSLSVENFERLVPWYMKSRIECTNVEFVDNKEDDEIIVYKAMNEVIFACHGHKDRVGSVVNDLTKMLKIFPSEVHMGHWHRHSTIEDNDIELIINGSFAGTDDYAESIRKSNKPSQTLIIYNIEGQECIYKIKL